jgi:hypothetical protein
MILLAFKLSTVANNRLGVVAVIDVILTGRVQLVIYQIFQVHCDESIIYYV